MQKIIRFTPDEWDFIMGKVRQAGMSSYGDYIRQMAMKGYVVELDVSPVKELNNAVGGISRNINQIVKRVNTTDTLYKEDIAEIKELMDKVWQLLRLTLLRLL